MALYPTPGTNLAWTIPGGGPSRAKCSINARAFEVSGTNFCEVFANNTFNIIGQVANDNLPASMVASPLQVLIAAGGNLYVYWLQTTIGGTNPQIAGTFMQVAPTTFTLPNTGAQGYCRMVEYCDGFFVVLLANSQTFYLSALFDASTWLVPTIGGVPQPGATAQIIQVSVFSDNVQSICWSQRRLWTMGLKRSTVYYDSGSANIFDVDPSGTMENGTAAIFATFRLDNAVFWIDQDERGAGIIRRGVGYVPTRVSNHAVEFAMQGYPTIADCIGYGYQDQGHSFAVFSFPTAQKTWVYDVATGMWHERGYWNVAAAMYTMHKSQNHMFAFGKHLVGDPGSGNTYQMAIPSFNGGVWSFVTDNGNTIRRLRRSPHISKENQWTYHNELVLDFETGLGPEPPLLNGAGLPIGPQVSLRWSNDYGHSWSNTYMLDAGQAGQYRQRVRRTRLGRARDRVYEISVTDPIGWRLIEGYLKADDYTPQQRLASTYGKVT